MITESPVIKLNIVLHENQKLIHTCRAKYRVIKAGKRFGKTKWALFELCQIAANTHNGIFWYIAPTYRHAKQIAWNELKWLLPNQLVKRRVENELLIELVSGSVIQLIGAENEDSLRGPKLNGVIFDEAAYTNEHVWPRIIKGQLLGANGQESGFAYFISSPNEKGRNWFTGFHADAKRKEESGNKDWAAFYFTINDNPTLNPEQIQELKDDCTDDVWNLEYLAIESALAGQLFSEFSSDNNVADAPTNTPLMHYRAIDWGMDHPTVCIWASLDYSSKTVYITDEFVRSGLVISESSDMIVTRTGGKEIEWTVIDPSTAKRNSQTKRSDSLEFNRCGIPTVYADNNRRGYDVMKMFLKKGRLKVSNKCKTLIHELKNVQYGDKEHDDVTDCARYLTLKIHDSINGMNVFDLESQAVNTKEPEGSREISIFNPIFNEPKDQKGMNEIQSFLMEEIGA